MRAATICRVLVVVQTLALAMAALEKIASHRPRAVPGFSILGIASIAVTVVAVLARRNIVVAWACVHLAGALALIGYIVTGQWFCFLAVIIALIAMHWYSPNRL
jgi:hypothetical protein